jgi:hypothetical protein
MAGYVIRRERKPVAVELVSAPPVAPRVTVEKPRNRDLHRRAEVLGLFRECGARIDNGDPMTCARDEYRCEVNR